MIDRYGPSEGPLAILVHGAVVNRATLAPLARILSASARIRVWVADLPGHGSRRAQSFTFDGALDELRAMVGAAGHAPVVVAGDSLGGYLAVALGASSHSRLAGVVACGCTFPMRGAAGLGALLTDAPVSLLATLVGDARVEAWLGRAFIALGGDPVTGARVAAAGLRLAARAESIAALRRFDLASSVRAVACPITFVNGARDVPIVWLGREYARLAPCGRAVVVARAPHAVMTFAPRAVAAEINVLFGLPAAGLAP